MQLKKVIDYIENNLTNEMTLEDLSICTYYSLPHIHRSIKTIMDYTLKEYIRKRRLSEAAIELVETSQSIIDIAFKYQYNSNEAFTRAFKQHFSCTPKDYRKNGKVIGILKPYKTIGGRNLKLLNKIDSIYQKYYENPSNFNLEKELSLYTKDVIEEVKECNYSKESMNFAVKILFKIGKSDIIKELFQTYLKQTESLEEEDWARYNLMMIEYNLQNNLYDSFFEYYEWMKQHIHSEKWYFAVCNSSILLDFFDKGKGEDFIKVVNEIRNTSSNTVDNRQARFETSRALVLTYLKFKDYDKVSKELKIFNNISSEDKQDINYLFNRNEYLTRKIYYLDAVDKDCKEEVKELLTHINTWKKQKEELQREYNKLFNQDYYFRSYEELQYDRSPISGLRSAIHNAGCMFYFLKDYKQSLVMFDDKLLNGYLNSYSAGLYMGSIYALTNDEEKLLEAMSKQKRVLENTPDYWKNVEELKDLSTSSTFIQKVHDLQKKA